MELKDATVLVVDDEPMLLDIFSEWLQEEGCRVITAGDGAAALQILRKQYTDVIVSDVRMPVMDGVLLLKNLTAQHGTLHRNWPPKMIFISGFADLEPREAYNLGVEAMLQKPIERVLFVGAVRRSLRRHETWSKPATPGGGAAACSLAVCPGRYRTGAHRVWSWRFLSTLLPSDPEGTCSV